jgi:FG-GAP repeat protein
MIAKLVRCTRTLSAAAVAAMTFSVILSSPVAADTLPMGRCAASIDSGSLRAQETSTTTTTTTPPAADAWRSLVVTGARAGGGPHVELWRSGKQVIAGFYAYAPSFIGGVSVAAGDVNGDGHPDIVTGAGPGGGPHVRVFDGAPDPDSGLPKLTEIGSFYAYSPTFTGGVNVGVGDFNGDATMDIVTGPGAGGGPHVRVFDGAGVAARAANIPVLGEFMAYSPSFTGGVSVAAADEGGPDGRAEIVTGAGPGGGPHVRVLELDGSAMTGTGGGFMAYAPTFNGGVNVAAACINGYARVGFSTATQRFSAETSAPDGIRRCGGNICGEPEDQADGGVSRELNSGATIALGVIRTDVTPPVQLVVGRGTGDAEVLVVQMHQGSIENPFEAYNAAVGANVAVLYR